MSIDRDPLALDERTARLGRELFAQVRQDAREAAVSDEEQRRRRKDDGAESSLWDALFGDGDDGDGDGD